MGASTTVGVPFVVVLTCSYWLGALCLSACIWETGLGGRPNMLNLKSWKSLDPHFTYTQQYTLVLKVLAKLGLSTG
ncbi:hypothetical protein Y1Q_0020134 [Alligator mississippiensis]|uniref:Uncharacterized protein n=1 Tax=Alligator mississippiensis TaxID=8496 RepID=A0A151LZ79_ALLMI|nr:hypothetical protein Y1Q_0020134 [Alligator mississippiensis]